MPGLALPSLLIWISYIVEIVLVLKIAEILLTGSQTIINQSIR
jgi:hypothetical protein